MDDYVKKFRIAIDSMASIGDRILLVDPLGQAEGEPPKLYLFTNRKNLRPRYKANYDSVNDLSFAAYMAVLFPETKIRIDRSGLIPTFVERPASRGEAGAVAFGIDDPRLALAVIRSVHPAHAAEREQFADLIDMIEGGRPDGES